MKTYLAFKNQITGLQDVFETVKVVEKVAASSVHFLKQKTNALNHYADNLENVLSRLSMFYTDFNNPLLRKKHFGKNVLVIFTGDKGLVGGLWQRVVNKYLESRDVYQIIMMIGKKGEMILSDEGEVPYKVYYTESSDEIDQSRFDDKLIKDLFEGFLHGNFKQVDVLYPEFDTLVQQQPVVKQYLPYSFTADDLKEMSINKPLGYPVFEPSAKKLFHYFLKEYVGVYFRRFLIETQLSEFAARTVAMEHASAKTKKIIEKTIFNSLKERRALLTQKQIESFAAHTTLL